MRSILDADGPKLNRVFAPDLGSKYLNGCAGSKIPPSEGNMEREAGHLSSAGNQAPQRACALTIFRTEAEAAAAAEESHTGSLFLEVVARVTHYSTSPIARFEPRV
jgi:hypothetical protein